MLISENGPTPNCRGEADIFFGEEIDGREEEGRSEREELAKALCMSGCPYRQRCLEEAMVLNDRYGVWGGMGEGERKKFRAWLQREGYEGEVPRGLELYASCTRWPQSYDA
jgi:WhiB family redox-sensing transcriptional regulator